MLDHKHHREAKERCKTKKEPMDHSKRMDVTNTSTTKKFVNTNTNKTKQ